MGRQGEKAVDVAASSPRAELVRPLSDEIVRERLVDRFAARWTCALTLVEGAGGYGKSTAIAQAIRDNDCDPSGVDAYVRLRRRHREAGGVAAAMLVSLGVEPDDDSIKVDPLDAIVAAIGGFSPTVVCLHLDDVHQIAEDGSATGLLRDLVRHLPANGRLVVAGRQLPDLPTSRLRAADQVAYIGEEELAFTAGEQAELADRYQVDPSELERLAGWPAMTRLALVAGGEAPTEYLLEEVLGHLDDGERLGVVVASLAGRADDDLLATCGARVSARQMIEHIPLVDDLGDGRVRAHDLWSDVLDRLVEPEVLAATARAIGRWHIAGGRSGDAVDLALSVGAWTDARDAVMAASASGDARLSSGVCARWLSRFPVETRVEPELVYLEGMVARLTHGPGHGDELVFAAMEAFHERGQADHEATAALEVGLRGWLANDLVALLDVLGRAPRLIEAGIESMRGIQHMGDAVASELGGDFQGALDLGCSIDVDQLPLEFAELCVRHTSTMAFLVGRSDVGVGLAEDLVARNPSIRNQFILDAARFQAGDPSHLLENWDSRRNPAVDNQRDDFLLRVFTAMIDASFGREPEVDAVRRLAWDRSREHTFVALVEAAACLMADNEVGAGEILRSTVDRLGIDDPLVLGELLRFLPYSYVLLPEHRDRLRDRAGGPLHRERLAIAEAFVAARSGASTGAIAWATAGSPPQVLSALPLPWSVELAARMTQYDEVRGIGLGRYLLEAFGAQARDRFRLLVDGDAPGRRGASAILATEPSAPARAVRVQLCGPMQVWAGEAVLVLNRRRVRELLAALALGTRRRRDELMVAMWPDLDRAKARSNLATTLNYLRSALEPDRRPGEASYHLRQEGELVWLHRSASLEIDVWEIETHLVRARSEREHQHNGAAMTELARAIEWWVGEPFVDLRQIDAFMGELAAFDRTIEAAAAAVAEWCLSQDRVAEAVHAAERLLAVDALNERAFGVLLAAHLTEGDLAAARMTAERCTGALAAVGAHPSTSTRMLLRRLELRSSPLTPLDQRHVG